MYMNRSKSCSLDIRYTCDIEKIPDFDPSILQLPRCRHLTISCQWCCSACHIYGCLEKEAAPRLVSFKIEMEYMNDGEGYYMRSKNYRLFGGGAPVLSSVEMWGISLPTCMLPFGVLTDLTLNTAVLDTEMTLEEFYYSFIEMAPTLITLQLHGIILRAAPDEHRHVPINFPSLTSLVIRYPNHLREEQERNDGDYISDLWDCINVPALESLTLFWINREQFHTSMDSLRRQRVDGTTKEGLKSLCLLYINVDDYADDLTLACPNLSNLTLMGGATAPVLKFILKADQQKSMAPSNNNTRTGLLWPNLHTLSVASFEDDTLRALVLGRIATGLPLVKLYMQCPAGMRDWYRQHVEIVGPF
jgi:hypothetical protein